MCEQDKHDDGPLLAPDRSAAPQIRSTPAPGRTQTFPGR